MENKANPPHLSFLSSHLTVNYLISLRANNVLIDTTHKRRLIFEKNPNNELILKRARRQRADILREPVTHDQLSDPAKTFKLPFPFVYDLLPCRFDVDAQWQFTYMGREIFKELQKMFESIRRDPRCSAIWLYGTQGYGKSHILASMVCYLVSKGQKVVYIPDCAECRKDPVRYIRAAMLFAWVEEDNKIYEILELDTLEKMGDFFEASRDLVFVYDQLNALETDHNILKWLTRFRLPHKAILSSSANYESYLETCHRQSSERTLSVYGGLTVVSLTENN